MTVLSPLATMRVTILGRQPIAVALPTLQQRIAVAASGPRGPAGPDPWLEPVQMLTGAGSLTVDYAEGKHVRLSLEAATSIDVVGWPVAYHIARMTFEIRATGNFPLEFPGVFWTDGVPPSVTPGGRSMILLTTSDGGDEVWGHVAGLDFLLPED